MTAERDLTELAASIAVRAGELARTRRTEGVQIAATKSVVADIVTHADREVELLIRGLLADARPNDGFLGEESGAEKGTSGVTWVVDPIDGTVNYAYGIPAYAVSIAAVEGEPDPQTWAGLGAAVFNPAVGELFTATRGGGAWLGEERLRVNDEPSPAGLLVATGFGYDPAVHAAQFAMLARVMPIARDIRRIGAASLDLAYVAAGRLDAYFERGLWPWDHAAGALLVSEAGGRVGGFAGAAASRELTVAAAPAVFDQLLERIAAGEPLP
ncbi:MAG TPA: inositol monophosphatase family protein [Microbacteriaceae bacterium]|jgi:myo-inositol-1(or 4)-monophosphatase|nr:inositol monophosphatase family protein [Microbacteriaceae bacterium]HQZ47727.1 inositol monophosphatase family protein [Microbacteriaceae bacterium]